MNSVIFKTEYFLSGIWRAVSKQGSFGDLIHWFRVDRGLIRVKKKLKSGFLKSIQICVGLA